MCHANFKMAFGSIADGKRVNFIVGQNGSGKSAIMNALAAVFGAKQTDTGKKGSVKSWVRQTKNGKLMPKAEIRVTVSNEGPFPFEKKKFHKIIVFERHISHTGSSKYWISGNAANGKPTKEVISATKMKKIAQQFNIQGNRLTHAFSP